MKTTQNNPTPTTAPVLKDKVMMFLMDATNMRHKLGCEGVFYLLTETEQEYIIYWLTNLMMQKNNISELSQPSDVI